MQQPEYKKFTKTTWNMFMSLLHSLISRVVTSSTIPIASSQILGCIKIGTGFTITSNGILNVDIMSQEFNNDDIADVFQEEGSDES